MSSRRKVSAGAQAMTAAARKSQARPASAARLRASRPAPTRTGAAAHIQATARLAPSNDSGPTRFSDRTTARRKLFTSRPGPGAPGTASIR